MSRSEEILSAELGRVPTAPPAGTYPVVAASPLNDADRHRIAAWLGINYHLVSEIEDQGLPLVLSWKRKDIEARKVVNALAEHGVPAALGERVRVAAFGPVLTAMIVGVVTLPLLVPALLVGIFDIFTEPAIWTQLAGYGVALLWPLMMWVSGVRKQRARLRRDQLDRSFARVREGAEQPKELEKGAAELVGRVRKLRRFVLTSTLPEAVETDILMGLEGLEQQVQQLDDDRRKVRRALSSDGAERVRTRLASGVYSSEEASADLRAMEELGVGLERALDRVEVELDALDLALVRLTTHEAEPTAAELDLLIHRTRSARDAGDELARIHRRVGAARRSTL